MTDGPGQTLFRFVRHWSRRATHDDPALVEQGRLVLVTEAVDTLTAREVAATVGAVALEIGIDQSGASRLLAAATEAGHLSMRASRTDGRRREAVLTASGHRLLDRAHDWQEEVFDRLTEGWSDERRRELQRSMTDLVARSHEVDL